MDALFSVTRRGSSECAHGRLSSFPRADEPEAAWKRSIEAKALDAMRGLLPAASLSHVGIFASGQAYEQLLMRLLCLAAPRGAPVSATWRSRSCRR